MKNLLKFLPVALIALSFASCGEKKDWTCTCVEPVLGTEISTSVITDATESAATKECDDKDISLLGITTVECTLSE